MCWACLKNEREKKQTADLGDTHTHTHTHGHTEAACYLKKSKPPGQSQPPPATFHGPRRHGCDVLRRGSPPQQGGHPTDSRAPPAARGGTSGGGSRGPVRRRHVKRPVVPNQLGKPIEGDLEVDVGETELEFLGLDFCFLTALRAGPPFSRDVTSGGPPGGRSLSKDGTRADSAKDFCRLVGGV